MRDKTPVAVLAAVADNKVIGRDNQLIWQLSSDLKRFKALTMGCPLLMGRKTFQSIGRPLPGRESIVLTRDLQFSQKGVYVAHDFDAALTLCADFAARMGAPHVAVIGGAEIYALALPSADKLFLTHVHTQPEGDAYFPDYDKTAFTETLREDHQASGRDEFPFTFVDYQRKNRN